MTRLLSAGRYVAGLGAAVLLASCGWLGPQDKAQETCPREAILPDAGEATVFRAGAGRDLTDVVAQLRIADVVADCRYDRQGVTIDLQVAIAAERGPANRAGKQEAEYFVAVVDPAGTVVQRQAFRVDFTWPDNRARVGVVEDLEPRLANVSRERAGGYRIWVGLQLTEEQLAWNRSGAGRR